MQTNTCCLISAMKPASQLCINWGSLLKCRGSAFLPRMRADRKLGVTIRPPKTAVTAENKAYLQVLDVLELLDKAPVDDAHPYEIIARHIKGKRLEYGTLLAFANDFYNKTTVLHLASTASAGEMI